MKMAALLTRNAGPKPGVTGTARVDRDIDRLLRRVGPGDIVILDALDLDRITADALVEAEVAAVVNASSPVTRNTSSSRDTLSTPGTKPAPMP